MTWVAIGIMSSDVKTSPSVITSYRMDVIPSVVLDMCRSPYKTISYLLRDEHRRLEV